MHDSPNPNGPSRKGFLNHQLDRYRQANRHTRVRDTTLNPKPTRFLETLSLAADVVMIGGLEKVPSEQEVGVSEKLGVPYFGVLIIRILIFRVLY